LPDVIILQHNVADPPAAIASALTSRGLSQRTIRLYAGESVPASIGDARAFVAMGGPMSADDDRRCPFLAAERALLAEAIAAGRAVLGACLGAQIVATALGARVRRMPTKEIGWFDTTLTAAAAVDPLFTGAPRVISPFHWHGDVFDLPPGAVVLARSPRTPVQAFRHGARVYGLQFHLETNARLVKAMLAQFPEELAAERVDPAKILAEGAARFPPMEALAARVFGRWADTLRR
jgi:GMP synthase-like glutamine amidotransferase